MNRTIPFWVQALVLAAIGISVDIAVSLHSLSELLNPLLFLTVLCRSLLFSSLAIGSVWLAKNRTNE